MKGGDSGSQEMATLTRCLFTTSPVFDVYDKPTDELRVPAYLKDGSTGKLKEDRAGWLRNEMCPVATG